MNADGACERMDLYKTILNTRDIGRLIKQAYRLCVDSFTGVTCHINFPFKLEFYTLYSRI